MAAELPSGRDRRPVPDPTILTTEALNREINGVQKDIDTLRELLFSEIRHRGELTDEQFRSVEIRFTAIEDRTAEQKIDTRLAVDAALSAAKETQSKTETSMTKQIDLILVRTEQNSNMLNDKVNDLVKRFERIEGKSEGTQMSMGVMVAIAGIIGTIITIVIILANVFTGS